MQKLLAGSTLARLAGGTDSAPDLPVNALLRDLLRSSLCLSEDWEKLPAETREELGSCDDTALLLPRLVAHGLLTEYQADRIAAGTVFGLILGNYRVLDRLGAGGMGIVFKGEHRRLRRLVAIKVLPLADKPDPQLLARFFAEVRMVAQLQHPNIVGAFDAGETGDPDVNTPNLHYFVMEYVPGQDLEELILARGPLPPATACDLIHQVASALAEAHRHSFIHRDIKPSNIRVTPEGQVKLLDFGLARHFSQRMTVPSTMLGTLDYIAPEQISDASSVDARADLFSLGATLFSCLTARTPFADQGSLTEALGRRLTQQPPSARVWQPGVPAELDAVIARMMAPKPDDRYPTADAVMRALLPFLKAELREHHVLSAETKPGAKPSAVPGSQPPSNSRVHQVIVVDDERSIHHLCRLALEADGLACSQADDGASALRALRDRPYDLVLLDVDMPKMTGLEVLRHLREDPPYPHLKIIMFSGRSSADEMAQMLMAGADDYLTKPFSLVQLRARVKAALHLKEAQDRSDLLNRHLLTINHELEHNLSARDCDLVHARNALVLALAKLVEYRDGETSAHLIRLQRYCRCLAEEAAGLPLFAGQIDAHFIDMLECCAPLHDIGKVGLPDHILLKPGKLTPDERIIMQSHTIIGADTLQEVAKHHGFARVFLQMAIDIARHHHERFDGTGYPDRLAGSAIPLSAHLVALSDVYDALRSRRVYKPALSHAATIQVMLEGSSGHFDPTLLQMFQRCHPLLERISKELSD